MLLALALVATTARDIGSTVSALRGIPVGEDPTAVPLVARDFVASVKTELRDLAGSLLHDQPGDAKIAAAHLQETMHTALKEAGAFEACVSEYGNYGTLDEPRVTASQPDLIAVEVSQQVPCGRDSALFLFRYQRDAWHLVFDRERAVNESIGDAADTLMFRVSPPDAHGSLLVLTADINPWCSSNWQMLRWRVDRINPGWREPEPVSRDEEAVFLDDDVKLDVTQDTYSLRFSGNSIDGARVVRRYIRSYRIEAGNRLTRIEPIAETPQDFVEEWLLMTTPNDGIHLRGAFEQPVQCSAGVWQIALDPYGEGEDGEDPLYFLVAEEKGSYRMVARSDKPREGCNRG